MLSRRDEFAKAAMQGLLAGQRYDPDSIIRQSIGAADALIAKLDEGLIREAMPDEVDKALRYEIARLRTELDKAEGLKAMYMRDCGEYLIREEKALEELARYKEPLTDEQASTLTGELGAGCGVWKDRDREIRRVRGGE